MTTTAEPKRVVPFGEDYDNADLCYACSKWLSYLVTFIAVALSLADTIYSLDKNTSENIGYANTALICLYLFFEYRGSYLFRTAETKRKLAFIDNTFNTKFSEAETQEYYTNDNVAGGIYKMAVNNMESSFTTNKNLTHMYPIVLTKNVVIVMLVVFAGIFGKGNYARLAAESLVAANFALELFKITVYSSKVKTLLNEFFTLFQSLNPETITNVQSAQIMKQILEYETTVAWANLPLDNDYFMKHRVAWDGEWQKLKLRYNIR